MSEGVPTTFVEVYEFNKLARPLSLKLSAASPQIFKLSNDLSRTLILI